MNRNLSNTYLTALNYQSYNDDGDTAKSLYGLQTLECSKNQITNVDHLPASLQELECSKNQIIDLDHLPLSLQILKCTDNKITNVNYLPSGLQKLYCTANFSRKVKPEKPHKCWIYNQINQPGKFSGVVLFPRYCEDCELEYIRDMNLYMRSVQSEQNAQNTNSVLNDINYSLGVDVEITCNCYQQYFGYQTLKKLQKSSGFYADCLPDDIIKHILRSID